MSDSFLTTRGLLLRDAGLADDASRPERADGGYVFYHYTHADRVDVVLREGLRAGRAVNCSSPPPDVAGAYVTTGFLAAAPDWLEECPYFGDLGRRLVRQYVGDTLLRVVAPASSRCYVADYAHKLELRHYQETGRLVLGRGYDLSSRDDIRQAYTNSYIPIAEYDGGHVAPAVELLIDAPGIAVSPEWIEICPTQPFAGGFAV